MSRLEKSIMPDATFIQINQTEYIWECLKQQLLNGIETTVRTDFKQMINELVTDEFVDEIRKDVDDSVFKDMKKELPWFLGGTFW